MIVSAALTWLAAVPPGAPDPSTGRGAEWGKAAPIGLLIILLLGIALFFLIKSMNRNLAKVPKSFDSSALESAGEASTGPSQQSASEPPAANDPAARVRPAGRAEPPA